MLGNFTTPAPYAGDHLDDHLLAKAVRDAPPIAAAAGAGEPPQRSGGGGGDESGHVQTDHLPKCKDCAPAAASPSPPASTRISRGGEQGKERGHNRSKDMSAGAVSPSAADAVSDSPSAVDSDPRLAADTESEAAASAAVLRAAHVLYHTVPQALLASRGGGPAPIDDDLPAEVLKAAAAADGRGRVDASAVTLVTQFSMDRLVSTPDAVAHANSRDIAVSVCGTVRAGPRMQHWPCDADLHHMHVRTPSEGRQGGAREDGHEGSMQADEGERVGGGGGGKEREGAGERAEEVGEEQATQRRR